MRTGTAILLPVFLGEEGIFYAEILAWIGADVILVTNYYLRIEKNEGLTEFLMKYGGAIFAKTD